MSKQCAPIIIPTLNRYEHFKRCVASLAKNKLASETELVIGLDYPPSEKYVDGYTKIKEYLPTISGFKKVTVLTTEKNLNPVGNSNRLREYVHHLGYDSFIATEDDNEFSPIFLEYVNWGLEKFKDSNEVFAICGHRYLINIDDVPNNVHRSRAFSAWGYGSWFSKWDKLNELRKSENLKKEVDSVPLSYLFNRKRHEEVIAAAGLIGMLYKKYTLGDALVNIILRKNNMMCIFPKKNLVRNWGIDGSGLHSGQNGNSTMYNYYSTEPLAESEHFVVEDENNIPFLPVIKKYRRFYSINKPSLKMKLYCFLKFIFYKKGFYFNIERVR